MYYVCEQAVRDTVSQDEITAAIEDVFLALAEQRAVKR